MNDQDYLGIQSQALSRMAEALIGSTNPDLVRPVLMKFTTLAILDWKTSGEEQREELLNDVRKSLGFVERQAVDSLNRLNKQPSCLNKKPTVSWRPKRKNAYR